MHFMDLFDPDLFDRMVLEGMVRIQSHPTEPLKILNYTEKAAFDGVWNDVTLACRGLIFNSETGELVARPFPKFFNYGQAGCPTIDLDSPAIVSDKLDGSLGILYSLPSGGWAIATRGSFTSDQALHATKLLNGKYSGFTPEEGHTYLFEIIYPENRIVCDYGGLDDLVFLGSVHIESGISMNSHCLPWPGRIAEVFPYRTMREALAAPARDGMEGFVVHFPDGDFRVKIKQADYIALHRIVTGLNARSVWEAMLSGTIDDLIEKVPDEFHDFVRGVQRDLHDEVTEFVDFIFRRYIRIVRELNQQQFFTKKDFALRVKGENYSWALFAIWDGASYVEIYRRFLEKCKPEHNYSPVKVSSDAD